MAEGFARNILLEDVKIFSTGTDQNEIHPVAIKVMQEVGIDISEQKSKNLWEIPVDKISIVVTLCGDAAERCPVFPGEVKKIIGFSKTLLRPQGTKKKLLMNLEKYGIK